MICAETASSGGPAKGMGTSIVFARNSSVAPATKSNDAAVKASRALRRVRAARTTATMAARARANDVIGIVIVFPAPTVTGVTVGSM